LSCEVILFFDAPAPIFILLGIKRTTEEIVYFKVSLLFKNNERHSDQIDLTLNQVLASKGVVAQLLSVD
jgi:hypothetical protein